MLGQLKIDTEISDGTGQFLDISRGVCVLLVVIGHFRSFLFVDYSDVESVNIFTIAFYFLTSQGHFGVIIFFVISGYLCGGRYLKNKNDFLIDEYLKKRLSRVYVVLVPSIVLTFFLDYIGLSLNIESYYGSVSDIASITYHVDESINWYNFISTIFLVNKHEYIFGSNTPLWSLSYEMYFYVLFALLMCVFSNKKTHRAICCVLFFMSALFMGKEFLAYYFIWAIGLMIPLLTPWSSKYGHIFKINALLIWVLIVCFFAMIKTLGGNSYINDIIVAMLFVVMTFFSKNNKISYNLLTRMLETIGKYSFSLYVIHFPLGFLLVGIYKMYLSSSEKIQLDYTSFILFIFLLIITFFLAKFFYHGFESKNQTMYKIISGESKGLN
ncbi:acyltransferase family protein [Vibrio cyclitrophicus]